MQGACAKSTVRLHFLTCARLAIFLLKATLVPKVAMANSNSNIDVGELVANIVNYPDF